MIVHRPAAAAGTEELRARAAQVHADTVARYVSRLTCPPEQKKALIGGICAAELTE